MKKIIIFITALIFYSSFSAFAQVSENSQAFIKNFSTCTNWVDNGENRISIILGWSTRKCYYQEISHNETVNCGFKQLELQDMVNIMKRENFDHTKGITSLKGADKYLIYSPDVCKVNTRNEYGRFTESNRHTRRR